MAFPYSYKKSLVKSREELNENNIDLCDIQNLVNKAIQKKNPTDFKIKNQTLSFKFIAPVFNFKYSTEIKINLINNELIIDYEVNFENLVRIVLIIIILTAFFSFLSIKWFLITSALMSAGFFGISFLIIDNFIYNLILQSIDGILIKKNIPEKLSEEQVSWINDESKCSACGEDLSAVDLHCPDCGIKLKRNRHTTPLNVSKYQDRKITYHIKK
ncbi:MAG: zinc ribbon domain-containing protein [Bacteroidales bacterium]|nr:zinc ribbon domain-containing protein [Bacteroidales bacterium]